MSESTSKPSKKLIISFIVVGILGLLVGSGITYAQIRRSNSDKSGQPISNSKTPEGAKPATQIESKLPDGTISPSTIIAKASEYDGKDVAVRGLVVNLNADKYVIVGQQSKDNTAINLDTSTNPKLNLKDFVGATSGADTAASTALSGPVTIKGTFKLTKPDENSKVSSYSLVIKSVTK